MALGGERAARRGGLTVASVLLRALLIIAVVLMPLLTCPAACDAAPGIIGTSARSVGADKVPHVLANLVGADDHHECHVLPVFSAASAAAVTLSGWAVAVVAVTVTVLAVCAMWRPSTHGPPRVRPYWLLSNGHKRLVHFCVMRR
ncbi:hypothetical protein [Mycobacteroides salmoniphilum]|uniref:hypothetical protein n=1 Tax=Mycobacteroides salmoniphilum TaxID=404941 RepID=UPI0010AAC6B6|nr:hypothetical protein [Mycobacteroides salmoniphilum]QCH23570.1 hypothetical protein DSM43276_01830 [Mycobacteroides salmoniphilum]